MANVSIVIHIYSCLFISVVFKERGEWKISLERVICMELLLKKECASRENF